MRPCVGPVVCLSCALVLWPFEHGTAVNNLWVNASGRTFLYKIMLHCVFNLFLRWRSLRVIIVVGVEN